jgi:hypothetical protein
MLFYPVSRHERDKVSRGKYNDWIYLVNSLDASRNILGAGRQH